MICNAIKWYNMCLYAQMSTMREVIGRSEVDSDIVERGYVTPRRCRGSWEDCAIGERPNRNTFKGLRGICTDIHGSMAAKSLTPSLCRISSYKIT